LDTHVHDVLGVIEYEDIEDVVLVGHSYAGTVVTAVAEVVAEKLSHLVYLDAWVPKDGQAMFDLMPPERAEGYREAARVSGEGEGIPPLPIEAFGIADEEDARWFASKLVLQPLKTFEGPVRLSSEAAGRLPHTQSSLRTRARPWRGRLEDYREDVKESHEKTDRENQAVEQLPAGPLPSFGIRQRIEPELVQGQYTRAHHKQRHQHRVDGRLIEEDQRSHKQSGNHPENPVQYSY
jgi:pimeloyl-ACP methyl ester carboxylesterase